MFGSIHCTSHKKTFQSNYLWEDLIKVYHVYPPPPNFDIFQLYEDLRKIYKLYFFPDCFDPWNSNRCQKWAFPFEKSKLKKFENFSYVVQMQMMQCNNICMKQLLFQILHSYSERDTIICRMIPDVSVWDNLVIKLLGVERFFLFFFMTVQMLFQFEKVRAQESLVLKGKLLQQLILPSSIRSHIFRKFSAFSAVNRYL